MKTVILSVALLVTSPAMAQTNQPAVEDFKPSSLNQPGKQYPQVNSERRVRARVVAPQAQSVALRISGRCNVPPDQGRRRRLGRRHAAPGRRFPLLPARD